VVFSFAERISEQQADSKPADPEPDRRYCDAGDE
jgi:hypothetical protein